MTGTTIKAATLLFILTLASTATLAQRFFEVETIGEAKVKIYAVDSPEQADLLVYFVYEAKDVTKIGYWMEVPTPKEAQVLLIFVDDEKLADFRIWLVDTPEEAGWRNPGKKNLLKVPGLE